MVLEKLLHVEIVPDFTLVQTTKICNVHVPLTMKKKWDMLCWKFFLHEEGFFWDNSSKEVGRHQHMQCAPI